MSLRIGILTVSDRVSAGEMEDRGGVAIAKRLAGGSFDIIESAVVPDEIEDIARTLASWCDESSLDAVFTTGGTGLSPRDVTPEATARVCSRLIPGIAEAMRRAGEEKTPYAMLSRAVAGLRGATIIVNLPGSPRGAVENLDVILPVLDHAIHTSHGGKH
jgi:molybdenum cofactor synthesis domain-containing protein